MAKGHHMGFANLKRQLAARGATDPGALAAYIGRRKYGAKGMGKLAAGKKAAPLKGKRS